MVYKHLPRNWVGKIPWRRKWQPTPAFLLGEFHGQRSLMGYSPWGLIQSDTTKQLSTQEHPELLYPQGNAEDLSED